MSFLHLGAPSSRTMHDEDSAFRLMQSISENQSSEQMALHFPVFFQTNTLSQVLPESNSKPLRPGWHTTFWVILPLLQVFSCWHFATWSLLELEVTCTSLHLNKSFFNDYFLTPLLTHLCVWLQHQPVAMSSVIQLCAVWSIISFCLF